VAAGVSRSATAVVVATTDRPATTAFLGLLGFSPDGRDRLVVPGGAAVAVELVDAGRPGAAVRDFDEGPRALDLYTTDLEGVLAEVAAAGWECRGPGTVSIGPVTMRQAMVGGPDGLAVVLVESTHRRSSLLDVDPDRRLSEPHSVVWCVPDRDAEAARWVAAGWTKGMDLAFSEPAVSDYLGLPRSPVPIRMTMLSGPDVEPVRLELLEFPDDRGAAVPGDDVAGLRALVFEVDDVPSVAAALELGPGTGCTPGGVRVELRPRS
jgi:hypothetical protein